MDWATVPNFSTLAVAATGAAARPDGTRLAVPDRAPRRPAPYPTRPRHPCDGTDPLTAAPPTLSAVHGCCCTCRLPWCVGKMDGTCLLPPSWQAHAMSCSAAHHSQATTACVRDSLHRGARIMPSVECVSILHGLRRSAASAVPAVNS